MTGQIPRLSKVNLFTLFSLWMELFPSAEQQKKSQLGMAHGLYVGLWYSLISVTAKKLNNLQTSVLVAAGLHNEICFTSFIKLASVQFPHSTWESRSGVNRISYWPADPEISLQNEASNPMTTDDAKLDAKAVERLKSNSRARVCVLLQPLVCYMVQFIEETSTNFDFIQKIAKSQPDFNTDFYTACRQEKIKEYESLFLISNEETHKQILMTIGLENLCENPYFSNLRQNMKDLVLVLATVAASVPVFGCFGFYSTDSQPANETHHQGLPQEIARHCMIQARLLAYRTEDHKTGVGAIIWAEEKSRSCDGTGAMYFVGCGYNAFPVGSEYADFPHMDDKQKDREIRKFRYIIHAEQNALTFRCREIKPDERSMIFVTKCPCDECVPLIKGAGIKQIYAGDVDAGKKKADISYMKFGELEGVTKFT
ncbi:Cytidine and dCMP deaminase domain-containing protein 1, partial [Anas platyrhynchos]